MAREDTAWIFLATIVENGRTERHGCMFTGEFPIAHDV